MKAGTHTHLKANHRLGNMYYNHQNMSRKHLCRCDGHVNPDESRDSSRIAGYARHRFGESGGRGIISPYINFFRGFLLTHVVFMINCCQKGEGNLSLD
jgi:hypothetical protein